MRARNLPLITTWMIFATTTVIAQQEAPVLVPTLGHTNKISAVRYLLGGQLLLTGASDGAVVLWDVDSGSELKRYVTPSAGVLNIELLDGDSKQFVGYEDGTARIWDIKSGTLIRTFHGYVDVLAHDYLYGAPFAITTDGKIALTADEKAIVHLWNSSDGVEKKKFAANVGKIGYAAFSPSSPLVLVAGSEAAATFDVNTGQQIWRTVGDSGPVLFSRSGAVAVTSGVDGVSFRQSSNGALVKTVPLKAAFGISLSPDERTLIGGTFSTGASVWDVTSSKKLWDVPNTYGSDINSAPAVDFSPDGRSIACALVDRRMGSWDSEVRIFSREDFKQIGSLRGATARLLSIGFIGHSPYILGADPTGAAFLWSAGKKSVRFAGHIAPIITGAVSPDGRHVVLGSLDQSVSLWDGNGDERFHFAGHTQYIASTSFSHNGKYVFSTGGAGFKWSVETGQKLAQFGGPDLSSAVLMLYPTADDKYVFTQAFDRTLIWTDTGSPVPLPRELRSSEDAGKRSIRVSPDGRIATVNCKGASEATSPKPILGLILTCESAYHGHVVGMSKDGAWVMSSEGPVAYLQNGESLLSFDQERGVDFMAVSDDDSLLLTASLQDNIVHLWNAATRTEMCRMVLMNSGNWVIFDTSGRFDTDEIEETQGLNWTMPRRSFQPVALEAFTRDYFTPGLLNIELSGSARKVPALSHRDTEAPGVEIQGMSLDTSANTVKIKVEVLQSKSHDGGHSYDLRVFRNGQLVASVPPNGGLLDPYLHDQTIEIPNIQLPSMPNGGKIEFSAYAFNKDGIKGKTGKKDFNVQSSGYTRPRTAYILTFGVNVFDDPRWNLQFAASDARDLSNDTYNSLLGTSQFDKILRIPLISDFEYRSNELPASKFNLQAALSKLSGHELPNVGMLAPFHLSRATPDDLVLVHIATHGYTDDSGVFYLLPSDIGAQAGNALSAQLKAASISSSELLSWISGIDAGEIVLILDTCQAAAVAGLNFKPAPMDDRSFGQLVYDKKIRLLVGTQSDSVALEVNRLRHGLLTYSLIHDGLESRKADFDPIDHTITISEWLEYALLDVGELQAKLAAGTEIDSGVIVKRADLFGGNDRLPLPVGQRPTVFDFGKRSGPVLWGQKFFDSSSVKQGSNVAVAEFKAAADISDPVAAAAALKRFISKHRPGAATAAAWPAVTVNLIEAHAPSVDLISAARLSVSHLSLINDDTAAATAAAVLMSVADELDRRHEFADVAADFRQTGARVRKQ